jgi:penicillin-binding protein 1A
MTMRTGLNKSKNMISIRLLQAIGPKQGQEWITRFGFDAAKHPAYLTMALGAGSVTPLQMAAAYAVFANGGHRVNPWLIADHRPQGPHAVRIHGASAGGTAPGHRAAQRLHHGSLLQDVARVGTAAKAQATLKRPDLYGKTGTTNDRWTPGLPATSPRWPSPGSATTPRATWARAKPAAA